MTVNKWPTLLGKEVSEDIEFYESDPKSAGNAELGSMLQPSDSTLPSGGISVPISSVSETDVTKSGVHSRYSSDSGQWDSNSSEF